MRSRLEGIAVALALVLAGCGSDGGPDDASPVGDDDGAVELDLASARDTLPPAPGAPGTVTVLLTHPNGAGDPGFDAAVGALAQRPDIDLVLAVAGADATMSGFPVDVSGASTPDAVAVALADPHRPVDLVVVGVRTGHGIGEVPAEADVAVRVGVPVVVVQAEEADVVDLAGATMHLLEVLDLELDALRRQPAAFHRLVVPSCDHGIMRGRVSTAPGRAPDPDLHADCASTGAAPSLEADAFAQGWATLTRLR